MQTDTLCTLVIQGASVRQFAVRVKHLWMIFMKLLNGCQCDLNKHAY